MEHSPPDEVKNEYLPWRWGRAEWINHSLREQRRPYRRVRLQHMQLFGDTDMVCMLRPKPLHFNVVPKAARIDG